MRIIRMQRDGPLPRGVVALFDVKVDGGLTVYGMALRRSAAGEWRVYPPYPDRTTVVRFAPDVMAQINRLAGSAYEGGRSPNDDQLTAA